MARILLSMWHSSRLVKDKRGGAVLANFTSEGTDPPPCTQYRSVLSGTRRYWAASVRPYMGTSITSAVLTGHLHPENKANVCRTPEYVRLLNQRPIRRFFRRNHHRRRDPVSRLNVQQPHTLRRAPRLTNELRFNPNDLPILRNQHHLGFLRHLRDAYDLAVALRGLDVDHAFAAAIRQTILIRRSALAVAILRNRKNERAFLRNQVGNFRSDVILRLLDNRLDLRLRRGCHAHNVILLAKIHATHAGGIASHGANIVLVKANRLPIMRSEENNLVAIGQRGRN